ncbi:MAG: O-antigen ligase family protein [Armatimonadetes bacterium]|nr:O-antigen ligase family protein [Armatimonadota bacterium]MDW8121853.1 O-antigen ligase family protein [Armatimonadota bacterium]
MKTKVKKDTKDGKKRTLESPSAGARQVFLNPRLVVAGLVGLLVTFLPYLGGQNDWKWTGPVLTVLLTAGGVLSVAAFLKRHSLTVASSEMLLLSLVLWQVLTLVNTKYLWASLTEISRWAVFAVVTVLVRRLSQTTPVPLIIALSLFLSGFLPSLWEMRTYLETAAVDPRWRVFGPFVHPNLFANYLLMILPVATALVLYKPFSWRLPFVVGTALVLICLFLTGSKGAFLSLGLVGFSTVLFWLARTKGEASGKKRVLFYSSLTLLALGALMFALPPIRERLEQVLSGQVHSWMFRIWVWKSSVLAIADSPLLGHGPGTFEWVYPRYAEVGFTRHAHNGFLQLAMDCGLPALLLLLVFFARSLVGALRFALEGNARYLQLGAAIGVLACLLHNLTETAWLATANLLALGVLCGLAQTGERERAVSWAPKAAAPVGVGLTLLGLFILGVTVGQWISSPSDTFWNPYRQKAVLERAERWDPLNAVYPARRAVILRGLWEVSGHNDYLQDGIKAINRALLLQPIRSGNYKIKAAFLSEMGREGEAAKALNRAIRVNPLDTEAYWKLAELYRQQGKQKLALRLYQKIYQMSQGPMGRYRPLDFWSDPYLSAAKIALARHWQVAGQKKKAFLLAKEADEELKSFLEAYLPILRYQEPQAADAQEAFAKGLQREVRAILETIHQNQKESERKSR